MGYYDHQSSKSTRKRLGKVENYIFGGKAHLLKAIEQKGEAIPGDLARELGWSRSTLAHNLAKLQAQKKIVKIGGGRSTRYRVMTPEESNALPAVHPAPSAESSPQAVESKADGEQTKGASGELVKPACPELTEGVESPAGWRGFLKKVFKS